MHNWEYGDERIGAKDLVFTISALIIGVGILTLPRAIAKATTSSDGWISIVLAGAAAILLAWLLAKLSCKFHNRTYFEFAEDLTAKPFAIVMAIIYCCYFLFFTAYITRSVAELAKQYLFDKTPLEIVSLSFLLVVIYAVSGSRIGLVRLTVLFLPFVVIVTAVFLLLSINLFEFSKLMPLFQSNWSEIMSGTKESIFSFLGFEAVLFYSTLLRKPKEAPKAAVAGVAIASVTYLFIYVFTIGIFSNVVTQNIMYPTLELAREVSVPGEFFERLESLFFIFWLISIFATSTIALDVTVQSMNYVVKARKQTMLYYLSPIIYLLSMMPQNIVELSQLGLLVSLIGLLTAIVIPVCLMVIAKIREVKTSG